MKTTLVTEIGGTEIEVEFEFDLTPYKPAKLTGPWEDSYPEEGGEFEVTKIISVTAGGQPVTNWKPIVKQIATDLFYDAGERAANEAREDAALERALSCHREV